MKGIFVTGTDTNVGKTWVGTKLVKELSNKDIDLIVRKPIESGWPENIELTDTWKLAYAAQQIDHLESICAYRFKAAISPDRAARIEGITLTLNDLIKAALKKAKETDFLYIEGAGGLYSPLCSDGLNVDLIKQLNLPVLLVVENKLGCINQALLNIEAIQNHKLKLKALVLNEVQTLEKNEMNNLSDLENLIDIPIFETNYNHTPKETFQVLADLICSE